VKWCRDHRLQPAGAEQADHLGVVAQRALVEDARRRLDPAPLHRDAQAVQPQLGGAVEVGRGALQVPPIGGLARPMAVDDAAGLRLPGIPLVVRVAALVLMGRGRRAPEKAGGHFEDRVISVGHDGPVVQPRHAAAAA
jgi:hypothetical protein